MSATVDPAIFAIKALTQSGGTITYAWLKREFGRVQISEAVWRSLNRGRAILESVDQLNQYLYSYAPMVASQWKHASGVLVAQSDKGSTRLIDYGCGQGLAGLLLHDLLGPSFLADVRTVIAIEPSLVALQRAEAVYRALAPNAAVSTVNKAFDHLLSGDFATGEGSTVHLFSNVLDIDGYDHIALLRKALRPGEHTIIAIGHDRTVHGYSQGMLKLKAAVENGSIHPGMRVHASGLESFACGNRGEPAVLWLCKVEVSDE